MERKIQKKRWLNGTVLKPISKFFLICSIVLFLFSPVRAAVYDDFEDGDYLGWLESTTGGTGGYGVVDHNESLRAYVNHSGSGLHQLSQDFLYDADTPVSFEMQLMAEPNTNCNASAGLTISFLNIFNTTIGKAALVNTTNPSSLDSNSSLINGVQHNYDLLMSNFASLAGLDPYDSSIVKMSLVFWATADSYMGSSGGYPHLYQSWASVHFDNIMVGTSVVPIPGTILLLGSGLLGLMGIRRRKK